MLGSKSRFAQECFDGGFVGTDFEIEQDLTGRLAEDWREFNREFIPIYRAARPDKTKIGAGLACGALWTVSKGIKIGDILLCPDGNGRYRVAEVTGEYYYSPNNILPHRRPVRWLDLTIDRAAISDQLKSTTGSVGTVVHIKHANRKELEQLLSGSGLPLDGGGSPIERELVEDVGAFAMEAHLEEFLIKNWSKTKLGTLYDIFQEDGETVGQQYPTDTGPLDILAISKDKKTLLVVELKKGRASDAVVGQTLRYMGYVKEELAEEGQRVEGAIIALEDDKKIRRALAATSGITFYRYQISFKLVEAGA